MIQDVPKPSALAARHRLKHAAPQDSTCSHSGAAGLGVTREMTATTVGARSNRVRSISSRAADGGSLSSAAQASSQHAAERGAGLTLEHDEAPGHELLVVGNAGGGGQNRRKLVGASAPARPALSPLQNGA